MAAADLEAIGSGRTPDRAIAGAPAGLSVGYRRRMAHRTFDRSPWLLEPDVSFLNHGSFGACPEPVLEAQRAWRDRLEREPVRFLDRELEGHLDGARNEVAEFLGADPDTSPSSPTPRPACRRSSPRSGSSPATS